MRSPYDDDSGSSSSLCGCSSRSNKTSQFVGLPKILGRLLGQQCSRQPQLQHQDQRNLMIVTDDNENDQHNVNYSSRPKSCSTSSQDDKHFDTVSTMTETLVLSDDETDDTISNNCTSPTLSISNELTKQGTKEEPFVVAIREAATTTSIKGEDCAPASTECPHILTPAMIQQIHDDCLPHSLQHRNWERYFAIGLHGDCIESMIRRSSAFAYSIVVIQTVQGHVLGGFVTQQWNLSNNQYYGSGQSFLFASHPDIENSKDDGDDATTNNNNNNNSDKELYIYHWTGSNDYCQICTTRQLCMGGQGGFGWLVQDHFTRGTTAPCQTFGNPPLVRTTTDTTTTSLSSSSPNAAAYFEIAAFEAYGILPLSFW